MRSCYIFAFPESLISCVTSLPAYEKKYERFKERISESLVLTPILDLGSHNLHRTHYQAVTLVSQAFVVLLLMGIKTYMRQFLIQTHNDNCGTGQRTTSLCTTDDNQCRQLQTQGRRKRSSLVKKLVWII